MRHQVTQAVPRSIGTPAVLCHQRKRAAISRNGHRNITCKAAAEHDDNHDDNGPSTSYSHTTKRLYNQLQENAKIGAEYGEGFLQWNWDGGAPTRLDVDTLNEKLRPTGAERLRHAHKPDEAFGIIFNFDTVIADTRSALRRAWHDLAHAQGKTISPHARLDAHNMCTERVIMDVLHWTRNLKQAREMSYELAEHYSTHLLELTVPQAGVVDWIRCLSNFNVPCALVSRLDKATVRRLLERMHLHDFFTVMVTAEDDMESAAQRFLSASMQLKRPPNLCLVFDDSPEAVAAAHNCTMKAAAVLHHYPAYKLTTADITTADTSKLTIYNIRRLFATQGSEVDFMDLKKQNSGDKPRRRRIANATFDP